MVSFRTCSDQPTRTSLFHNVIASRAQLGVAISLPRTLILAVSVVCLVLASTAAAKIIYVDDDAAGLNDGTSWPNAYTFLQDALADANSADKPVEIRVAQGVYQPDRSSGEPNGTGNLRATFRLINAVIIRGGFAGPGVADPNARDSEAYETILSGDLIGNDGPDFENYMDNSFAVVTGDQVDGTAVLDGCMITGGNANRDRTPGGGMLNLSASPTIANCIF